MQFRNYNLKTSSVFAYIPLLQQDQHVIDFNYPILLSLLFTKYDIDNKTFLFFLFSFFLMIICVVIYSFLYDKYNICLKKINLAM